MTGNLKEVFKFRELIKNLIIKEIKVKYNNSLLGFFWSLLDPLLTVAVFTIIFTVIIRIDVENYPLFLLCGVFPWTFFHMSLNSAVYSIVSNAHLVQNVNFPTEILPLAAVISGLINFLLELVILFLALIVFKIKLSFLPLVFLPLLIVIHLLITLGISFFVSSLFVFFKDISFILNFILRLFFYCIPIVYPLKFVPLKFRQLYLLNPLAFLINSYREVLFYGRPPDFIFLLTALLSALLVFILGYVFFNRYKLLFAERI